MEVEEEVPQESATPDWDALIDRKIEARMSPVETERDNLRKEAASYRTQRNAALREAHVLSTVLNAHNIAFDMGAVSMDTLEISDGKVTTPYSYSIPTSASNASSSPTPVAPSSTRLTRQDVEAMTTAQINERWDDVSSLMKAGEL